jgi:glucose/mannose-6-phosphate isomerase
MENKQDLKQLDPENMLGQIEILPEQLMKAWQLGNQLPLPELGQIDRVVIAGMGGSAIGGDLLASYARPTCKIPVFNYRDYGLPAWVEGRSTLVICSSHSGSTEETLSSLSQAIIRDCSILTLSTGGLLTEMSSNTGCGAWVFEHQGQPRTAVGFSFGMLLALFSRLGFVQVSDQGIQEVVDAMKHQQDIIGYHSGTQSNPARRLAGQLVGRYISIFAASNNEVIARRWKTQINELAKALAQFEGLPEADHNTLAGLINPEEALSKVAAIFLKAESDHARNKMRLDYTRQQFMLAGMLTDEVKALGNSRLAEMWTLLHFGDYVSYYLALMYGIDPTPIEALGELKRFLAQK